MKRSQSGKTTILKMSEARDRFPQMVSSIESGWQGSFIVGKYGRPTAAVVSYQRFEPVLADTPKKERIAFLIVEDLLPHAPQHIKTPAIAELRRLSIEDLMALIGVDELPVPEKARKRLRASLSQPEVLDRLEKRARLAEVLNDAREQGLYDILEDGATGAFSEDDTE